MTGPGIDIEETSENEWFETMEAESDTSEPSGWSSAGRGVSGHNAGYRMSVLASSKWAGSLMPGGYFGLALNEPPAGCERSVGPSGDPADQSGKPSVSPTRVSVAK